MGRIGAYALLVALHLTVAVCADPAHQADANQQQGIGEPVHIKRELSQEAAIAERRSVQGSYCDDSGTINQALLFACTNHMRSNPMFYADKLRARCAADFFLGQISNPPRQALNYDAALHTASQQHSIAMANQAVMAHVVAGEQAVKDRVVQAGYGIFQGSENIGFGFKSVLDVVLDWTCSDGHRNDLFACNVQDLGVGVYVSAINGLPYWTQNFGCTDGSCWSCIGGNPTGRKLKALSL